MIRRGAHNNNIARSMFLGLGLLACNHSPHNTPGVYITRRSRHSRPAVRISLSNAPSVAPSAPNSEAPSCAHALPPLEPCSPVGTVAVTPPMTAARRVCRNRRRRRRPAAELVGGDVGGAREEPTARSIASAVGTGTIVVASAAGMLRRSAATLGARCLRTHLHDDSPRTRPHSLRLHQVPEM